MRKGKKVCRDLSKSQCFQINEIPPHYPFFWPYKVCTTCDTISYMAKIMITSLVNLVENNLVNEQQRLIPSFTEEPIEDKVSLLSAAPRVTILRCSEWFTI